MGAELTHCDYEADLRRLARFVEANRAWLPRHVFAVDSLPQHPRRDVPGRIQSITRLSVKEAGRWRNVISRRIWARHAPSVKYLSLEDVLVDRADVHLDLAHWCINSGAFESMLSLLLTAIIAHIHGPQHGCASRKGNLRE